MTDRKQIIDLLQGIANHLYFCEPISQDEFDGLLEAIDFLKAEEPVPYRFDKNGDTVCGVCGCYFDKAYSVCPKCGRKVDWNG